MRLWHRPKMTAIETERYEDAVHQNKEQEARVELLRRRYLRLVREAELLTRKESTSHGAH